MNLLPTLERFGLIKASVPTAARQPERENAAVAASMGRASWESTPGFGFNQYARIPQPLNLSILEQLVKTVPVINAALERIVQLVGCPILESEDTAALKEFNTWRENLRVNRTQTGFDPAFATFLIDHLTYGRAHCEIRLNASLTDVYALQELHPRTIELRPKERGYGVDYIQNLGVFGSEILLKPELMLTAVHDLRTDNPQGNSLLMGLEFMGEIWGKLMITTRNVWERFGEPIVQVGYEPDENFSDPTGTKGLAIAQGAAGVYDSIMKSRSEGKIRSLATSGMVKFSIIGAEGEILALEIPERRIMEQIVAKTGLPPFLLGLQWATTERMSQVQAQLLSRLVGAIRGHVAAEVGYLFRLRQALVGRPFDWSLTWDAPSLVDDMQQAEADKTSAEADSAELKVLEREWTLGIRSAEDVARARRPEMADLSDAEIHAKLPNLLAEPPVPPASPFGGRQEGNPEEGGRSQGGNSSLGRGLDLYSSKVWSGNGRNGRH